MMKAIPRRVAGSAALAVWRPLLRLRKSCQAQVSVKSHVHDVHDDLWPKIRGEIENHSKYDSIEDLNRAIGPMIKEDLRIKKERYEKQKRVYHALTALIGIGGLGSVGYLAAHL